MEPDVIHERLQALAVPDMLAAGKLNVVRSLLEVMVESGSSEPVSRSLAMAPVDDKELTPETAASPDRARDPTFLSARPLLSEGTCRWISIEKSTASLGTGPLEQALRVIHFPLPSASASDRGQHQNCRNSAFKSHLFLLSTPESGFRSAVPRRSTMTALADRKWGHAPVAIARHSPPTANIATVPTGDSSKTPKKLHA